MNSAINGKKAVILKNYASSHSKVTKDYRVEPFKLNTNYIDIWAYDLADGDVFIWEGDVNGMNGVGRFVLGLPRHIEVLEGDDLREFLRGNAEFILKK